jgi:hypothetical protein
MTSEESCFRAGVPHDRRSNVCVGLNTAWHDDLATGINNASNIARQRPFLCHGNNFFALDGHIQNTDATRRHHLSTTDDVIEH